MKSRLSIIQTELTICGWKISNLDLLKEKIAASLSLLFYLLLVFYRTPRKYCSTHYYYYFNGTYQHHQFFCACSYLLLLLQFFLISFICATWTSYPNQCAAVLQQAPPLPWLPALCALPSRPVTEPVITSSDMKHEINYQNFFPFLSANIVSYSQTSATNAVVRSPGGRDDGCSAVIFGFMCI